MTLSILICSLENRSVLLNELLDSLKSQIGNNKHVEILTSIDSKQSTTGFKRNALLHQAKGDYIVFIDDDDCVADYYIKEMLKGCESGLDCIAINGNMTTNGSNSIDWRLSKDYQNVTIKENGKDVYLRKTNHITAVKRSIAIKVGFPNKSNAEDKAYSDGINHLLKTEYKIEKPMYTYRYSTFNKEYK